MVLPEFTVQFLRCLVICQKEERLKAGSSWQDRNLVFTSTIGMPVDERDLRREFRTFFTAATLP